ncbi:hypothetical protein [Limimonas halophila]|uniref:hypothetical protein n=1 Tax=Limimonas halophila TaxID=1082479 RepID=UPI001FDF7973|nr:hypothetical protein [Limimonas halophila]
MEESFDEIARDQLWKISAFYSNVIEILYVQKQLLNKSDDKLKHSCINLIDQAMVSFTASVDLARRGFRKQHAIMTRNMDELLMTVVYILSEEEGLERFYKGNIKHNEMMRAFKKIFPDFGHMYGLLSDRFVHVNQSHAETERPTSYRQDEESLAFIIQNLRLHVWLLDAVTELAFIDEIQERKYFTSKFGGLIEYNPSKSVLDWLNETIGDEYST